MRSRAGFGCAGRNTRNAASTGQLDHVLAVPGAFCCFFSALAVFAIPAAAVLVVLALLAVLLVLSMLAMLALLFRRHRIDLRRIVVFSSPPILALVIVNGPNLPSPRPRETVTISLCSGGDAMILVERVVGVWMCVRHRTGPRTTAFGPLTGGGSSSAPRLEERVRPYSVKLPLSLRRSPCAFPATGFEAAAAPLTRSAHSLRFQIRPVLPSPLTSSRPPYAFLPPGVLRRTSPLPGLPSILPSLVQGHPTPLVSRPLRPTLASGTAAGARRTRRSRRCRRTRRPPPRSRTRRKTRMAAAAAHSRRSRSTRCTGKRAREGEVGRALLSEANGR